MPLQPTPRPTQPGLACHLALVLAVTAAYSHLAGAAAAGSYKPGVVFVKFKDTFAGKAAAAGQLTKPLKGLRLQRLVGDHHTLSVERPPATTAAAGGGKGAAGPKLVSVDGTTTTSVPPDALMLMEITDGMSPPDKAAQLSQLQNVKYAEPVYLTTTKAVPNDPFYTAGPAYSGMWFLDKISAPAAWDVTKGSASVIACIIDTGARRTHQDLSANIQGGWNRGEDLNGDLPRPGTAAYNNFTDDVGHGTHVTGSVGATGNNGFGITGVAWTVGLWHCKAGNGTIYLSTAGIIDCYSLCASIGAKVVSASYGRGVSMQAELDAIQAMANRSGALLIAAAGNRQPEGVDIDSQPVYPCSYNTPSNNVISVAATLPSDELAAFSNWGNTTVDLAAPGVNILSTVHRSDSMYDWYSGTSMAAPLVSGAITLMFAVKPSATIAEIRHALLSSVDKVDGLTGRVATGGRLNCHRALAAIQGQTLPATPTPTYIITQLDSIALWFVHPDCARCQCDVKPEFRRLDSNTCSVKDKCKLHPNCKNSDVQGSTDVASTPAICMTKWGSS